MNALRYQPSFQDLATGGNLANKNEADTVQTFNGVLNSVGRGTRQGTEIVSAYWNGELKNPSQIIPQLKHEGAFDAFVLRDSGEVPPEEQIIKMVRAMMEDEFQIYPEWLIQAFDAIDLQMNNEGSSFESTCNRIANAKTLEAVRSALCLVSLDDIITDHPDAFIELTKGMPSLVRARVCRLKDNFAAAEIFYYEALESDQNNADIWYELGLIISERINNEGLLKDWGERHKEAIKYMQEAVRLNPNHGPAHCALGEWLLGQKGMHPSHLSRFGMEINSQRLG